MKKPPPKKPGPKKPTTPSELFEGSNITPAMLKSQEDLVERMQTPEWRAGIKAAVKASPAEMGRFAVEAERKNKP